MKRKLLMSGLFVMLAVNAGHALDLTPPQTEGPYYPARKPPETDTDLTQLGKEPQAQGDVLMLTGTVVDPDGKPIAGALVEIWQADHQGIYWHPRDPRVKKRDLAFQGFGAMTTGDAGAFAFRTIMPGGYEARPPHIHVKVKAPAGPPLTTQLYFKDDPRLDRDAIAFELGGNLSRVLLAPKRPGGTAGPLEASITLVVERSRGGRRG